MNESRVLDAVWVVCLDLARRKKGAKEGCWTTENVVREVAGCMLASQVPHAMTVAALNRLVTDNLLPPSRFARSETRIKTALGSPLSGEYRRAYRFPSQAAQRLVRFASLADQVVDVVVGDDDVGSARRRLMAFGFGLGPKQASLLLRNIREDADVAVVDVHLLAFMRIAGLTSAAKAPATLAGYEELEDRFRTYAHGIRVPMHCLDMAAWIVMRAMRTKEAA